MPIRNSTARRERAREHARRDILLACGEVFARRGFAAATLAELAEAAGFAAPSLYRYFESKEEIFRSLVEMLAAEMEATFAEPVDRSLPLGGRILALLRAQVRVAETHRSAFEVLDKPGPELPAGVQRLRSPRAGVAFWEARILDWLRRNATRAELRQPLEAAARALTGIVIAFGRCADASETLLQRMELAVDLAVNGIAAPASRRRGA